MTADRLSVTVIAPCYNALAQLDAFLARLERTLVPGVDVVLIDDASADGTADVLERWAASRDDARLLRVRENGGVAAARNRALAEIDSEFVWFVDVDDEWDPRIVSTLATEAERSAADIVVCRALYRTRQATSGRVIDGLDRRELVSSERALERMAAGELHGFLWNKLFRRRILQNELFPRLTSQSDFVGVLRAVQEAERVLFIPDILYSYVYTASSITRRRDPNLGNLLVCAEAMRAALERTFDEVPVALSDWFTTWFYAVPVALTPIRQNADPALVRTGIGLGSAALKDVHVLRSARRPRMLVLALVLKHVPAAFALISRVLYSVHDTHRRLSDRRSTPR
ncbi:glycosyltransferase family 2 protein [Rathayibacter tanaceti]|uniref:Glycosyltransferase n=2 Tax=Rathayibacter tanaceti TaxID=1671680 RepID=A0A162J281_9MICO|nr:glycosyltransferase [Rathayibacter tanaceti]KZX21127.1 putative glycosyltransferase EpsH [Rathayibacter tanaceti]QHC55852.1 glycosyltransferase [Rathayibacter tanaceti]TCO39322.1 glycosyl transferase family 2 [Rathayibacter tanaceti]